MTKALMTNLMTDLKDKTRTRLFSPLGLLDWWNKTQIHCLPLACDHRLDHMITDLLCWNIARLSNCPDITILNFEDFEGWFGHELVLWITLRLQIQKCWWRIACEYYQGRYRSANKTPHLVNFISPTGPNLVQYNLSCTSLYLFSSPNVFQRSVTRSCSGCKKRPAASPVVRGSIFASVWLLPSSTSSSFWSERSRNSFGLSRCEDLLRRKGCSM